MSHAGFLGTNAWNADGTRFYAIYGSRIVPFDFSAARFTATRSPDAAGSELALVQLGSEAAFSFRHASIIYGCRGANGRTILRYDFSTGVYTSILDLDSIAPGVGGACLSVSVSADETIAVVFGGPAQDQTPLILVLHVPTRQYALLDTARSRVNGQATSVALGHMVHNVRLDKGGRYVVYAPAGKYRRSSHGLLGRCDQ